jgi:hypothetical protein
MPLDWKSLTAIWGASLSTWLAIRAWLSDRPLITFEPTASKQTIDVQYYNIRLRNTTKKPIVFHSARIPVPRKARVWLHSGYQKIQPHRRNQPTNLLLYPGEEVFVQVDMSDMDEGIVAVLHWNFLPGSLSIPRYHFIWKTRRQMAAKRRYDFLGDSKKWEGGSE